MKSTRAVLAMVVFFLGAATIHAARANNPVDYAQRNGTFVTEPTIRPEVRAKAQAESLQNRRVDYPAVAKVPSPAADRRAPLDVSEARPKTVLPADARPSAVQTPPMGALSHRVSRLDSKDRLERPPMVAKYRDSLRAATALNPGRYPVIENQGWFARLNRFVFQRNRTPATDAPVVSVCAEKPAQP